MRAAVGQAHLLIASPSGVAKETLDCTRTGQRLDFTIGTATSQMGMTDYLYTYDAQVGLGSLQPATPTQWVAIPPQVVTTDGVVTELSYVPSLSTAYYHYTVFTPGATGTFTEDGLTDGTKGHPKVPVARLMVDAGVDQEPPQLNRIDAGLALVEQGGTLSINAAFSDGGSGLVTTPTGYFQPLSGGMYGALLPDSGEVALLGLYSPDQRKYYPLWPITKPSQMAVDAVVPGLLPPGGYQLYAQARDVAGNGALFQGAMGTAATMAPYVQVRSPVCVAPTDVPTQKTTSVPLVTVVVASQQTADQRPPELTSLSADPSGKVQPCQEVLLRMELTDNRRLPSDQQALMWVLPLERQASLMQVPAYPSTSAGVLDAHFVVPADGPEGEWLFYPAYAVDAANNALVGSLMPPAKGDPATGTILLGNQVNTQQSVSRVAPGRFCVGRCGPPAHSDGGTGPEAAYLSAVSFVSPTAMGAILPKSRGGDNVKLRFTYSTKGKAKLLP